jgi:hypothetical protein
VNKFCPSHRHSLHSSQVATLGVTLLFHVRCGQSQEQKPSALWFVPLLRCPRRWRLTIPALLWRPVGIGTQNQRQDLRTHVAGSRVESCPVITQSVCGGLNPQSSSHSGDGGGPRGAQERSQPQDPQEKGGLKQADRGEQCGRSDLSCGVTPAVSVLVHCPAVSPQGLVLPGLLPRHGISWKGEASRQVRSPSRFLTGSPQSPQPAVCASFSLGATCAVTARSPSPGTQRPIQNVLKRALNVPTDDVRCPQCHANDDI